MPNSKHDKIINPAIKANVVVKESIAPRKLIDDVVEGVYLFFFKVDNSLYTESLSA